MSALTCGNHTAENRTIESTGNATQVNVDAIRWPLGRFLGTSLWSHDVKASHWCWRSINELSNSDRLFELNRAIEVAFLAVGGFFCLRSSVKMQNYSFLFLWDGAGSWNDSRTARYGSLLIAPGTSWNSDNRRQGKVFIRVSLTCTL